MIATALLSGGTPDLSGSADVHDGMIDLTFRNDLTVRSEVHWPVFMEISADGASPIRVTIDGVKADDVNARTFPLGAPSEVLSMTEEGSSLAGTVSEGSTSTLLMLTFAEAGTHRMTAQVIGQSAMASAELDISGQGSPVFGEPVLGPWAGGWDNETDVGGERGFALSAPVDHWNNAPWGTYYNWTISVICPTGMEVGGDLSVYNTGDTRVDRSALEATSAISAWENGFNNVFYTAWEGESNMLSGTAAMTPNGKELTMAAGTYDEWSREMWTPFGAGTLRFNDPGHYLVVIHISDADGPMSTPLVLETVVS
mgnify:CR=1 FL=1